MMKLQALAVGFAALSCVAPAYGQAVKKIMALGDSITGSPVRAA